MSADNGIYIAEFPTVDGKKEYRVTYAMAIDNCSLDFMGLGAARDKMEDAYRWCYFGRCTPFSSRDEAEKEARKILEAMGPRPVLEYGICGIGFGRPLVKMSEEEANAALCF